MFRIIQTSDIKALDKNMKLFYLEEVSYQFLLYL